MYATSRAAIELFRLTLVLGPGATRALMAAAHRLRARPLHLRVRDRDDAACAQQAAAALAVAQRGMRIDDEDVDRCWRGIAP